MFAGWLEKQTHRMHLLQWWMGAWWEENERIDHQVKQIWPSTQYEEPWSLKYCSLVLLHQSTDSVSDPLPKSINKSTIVQPIKSKTKHNNLLSSKVWKLLRQLASQKGILLVQNFSHSYSISQGIVHNKISFQHWIEMMINEKSYNIY